MTTQTTLLEATLAQRGLAMAPGWLVARARAKGARIYPEPVAELPEGCVAIPTEQAERLWELAGLRLEGRAPMPVLGLNCDEEEDSDA